MSDHPTPALGLVALGATLFGLAALGTLWLEQEPELAATAFVSLQVRSPSNETLYDGSFSVDANRTTVLGALERAAELGNFTITVSQRFAAGAFVEEIAGHRAAGACGWIWERNGVLGDRASDRQAIATGDRILWRWGCES